MQAMSCGDRGHEIPHDRCTTKAKEGMVVNTKTEKVQDVRKFVIDLILSMHPLDCMTCTKAGVCNLQQYAYDFEIKESNFTRKKTDTLWMQLIPSSSGPRLLRSLRQMCKGMQGPGHKRAGIFGRGVGAKV